MWYVGEKIMMQGVVGASALFGLLIIPQAMSAEIAGEIVSVDGTVFVRPDAKIASSSLNPAQPGDPVHEGDVINSASDGKVKILMKDHTIVDLGPSALLKVDEFKRNQGANREVTMNMSYGSVRAAVAQKLAGKGRFKLRTPSAVMGVRGTEFIVNSPQPADLKTANTTPTQVTVVQGRVDVEPQQATPQGAPAAAQQTPIALTAGTQLTTQPTEAVAVQPVAVAPSQMTQIKDAAVVKDNTFHKAVAIDPQAASATGGSVTRLAVENAASGAALAAPSLAVSSAGFAGTFGNQQTFTPVNQNFLQAGMLRTITVNVLAP